MNVPRTQQKINITNRDRDRLMLTYSNKTLPVNIRLYFAVCSLLSTYTLPVTFTYDPSARLFSHKTRNKCPRSC